MRLGLYIDFLIYGKPLKFAVGDGTEEIGVLLSNFLAISHMLVFNTDIDAGMVDRILSGCKSVPIGGS